MKVGGTVEVSVDGRRLNVEAAGGLVMVSTMDTSGIVMWMWHPLSGWYIERDLRKGAQGAPQDDGLTETDE